MRSRGSVGAFFGKLDQEETSMRRFAHLTDGFSKNIKNRLQMLSLYFVQQSFVLMHKALKMTPVMAAGASNMLHGTAWIVALINARPPAP